ncbi:alpha/beta fold hydrolase [Halosimplex salinum]|uniref:alpha/beta fold hydrolase n=1 Tax=Halosimplex salinum TaxID=1710538 RepID=UPI000F47786C|nr:alpha/beta hydrolase [Halosimplex salinum]
MTATRSHTVDRADAPDLHVVETGPSDARPILLVHGYSQSHLSWRDQFDSTLAEEFRLVAMDLRGHGESEKPRGAYGESEAWAGDVQAVADALGLDEFVLAGWSYGSLVALDYLATHGTDRVAAVALVGVVAGIGTKTTNEWLQPEYLDLFPDLVSTDAETATAALAAFVDVCFHAERPPDERYLDLGFNAVVPPHVRDGMRDRTVSHLDLLGELSVPVLVTHGAHDRVVSAEAARAVADRIPDAELSVYPDCGHTPFRENAERFGRELRAFVRSLESGP